MNRPGGITASVVVLSFGSLLCLAMSAICVLVFLIFPMPPSSQTSQLPRVFVLFPIALFAGIGGWGLATVIGLLRIRRWGRISMLVFSGMLVLFNGTGMLMILFLPLPSADARTDHIMNITRIVMVAFYLVQVLVGIWWLVYFNRPKVKDLFLGAGPAPTEMKCPLSVTVIAWHFVIIGPLMFVAAWFQWPAVVFGLILTGWKAALIALLWGAVATYIGIGLLRLRPQSLMHAVYLLAVGVVNATIFWMLPNPVPKFREVMEQMKWGQMPGMETGPVLPPAWFFILVAFISFAIPVWYLLTRKEKYLAAGAAKKSATVSAAFPQ